MTRAPAARLDHFSVPAARYTLVSTKRSSTSDDWFNPSERDEFILACPVLDAHEKLVLWAISHHMHSENDAWPSQARIAARTALSLKTVKRTVSSLSKRGLLRITSANAKHRVNHYAIAWDLLAEAIKEHAKAGEPATPPPPAGGVRRTPLNAREQGPGDPTTAPEPAPAADRRGVRETLHRVRETLRQGLGDPTVGSDRPPEREKKGPPKEEGKGLCRSAPLDEGGELNPEVTEGRDLPEESANACTLTGDSDSDQQDHPPAKKARTLVELTAELEDIDPDQLDPEDDDSIPLFLEKDDTPAVQPADPEAEAARLYCEQQEREQKKALSLAKQLAAELDLSLGKARNPRLPAEKRVMHARFLVRGVEKLASMVGPVYRVSLQESAVRFANWSDECLAALEQLHPEVRTWDLFLAFECISDMNANCWRVAVKEEVWKSVAAWAEAEAGRRLARELGIVSHVEATYLEAVRKFRAGLIDRDGNRTAAG